MHYLDIIIVIILVASAVEGGIHGFVYEVFSLIGLLAGLFLAMRYFAFGAQYLHFLGLPDWVLNVIAFMLILIVVSALLRMVGGILRRALHKVFMGWLDHAIGVIFGIIRGGIVAVLITLVLMLTPMNEVLTREAPKTRLLKPALQFVKPILEVLIKDHVPLKNTV